MLCSKCQQFCIYAAKQIRLPNQGRAEAIPDIGDVRWDHFATVLHHSLSQLKATSDQQCPICRIIYSEQLRLNRFQIKVPETCTIVLEIEPKIGPWPMLSTTFRASGKDLIKLPVAGYSGDVVDGKRQHQLEADGPNDHS